LMIVAIFANFVIDIVHQLWLCLQGRERSWFTPSKLSIAKARRESKKQQEVAKPDKEGSSSVVAAAGRKYSTASLESNDIELQQSSCPRMDDTGLLSESEVKMVHSSRSIVVNRGIGGCSGDDAYGSGGCGGSEEGCCCCVSSASRISTPGMLAAGVVELEVVHAPSMGS
jgi:hypothetical protein